MKTVQEKSLTSFDTLKGSFGYTNVMESPRLVKVIVTCGIGSVKDKKKVELVANRLAKITGQKPAPRGAKQSISNFKIRQGDTVGYQVTLRGKRMYDFLDRLLNVGLPRTRDFRGISANGIDEMGNYSFGIKEHTIFPETSDEDIKDVFGLGITVVTSSQDKSQTKSFLEHLGFPFKKKDTQDVELGGDSNRNKKADKSKKTTK